MPPGNNNDTSQSEKSLCAVCGEDDATMYCRQNGHGFCHECINVYALAAFQMLGSYSRLVPNSTSTEISKIGELPCPFFVRNGCPCNNMQMSHFDWDTETLNAFHQAERRINALSGADANKRQHNVKKEQEQVQINNLDDLMRQAVQNTLSIGASVACPSCGYHGVKDGACMHITCENCQCDWCYCCGRRRHRIGINTCFTCDKEGSHIEAHPGWGNWKVNAVETIAYAALHEFHRKRMCYFLRRLVEGVPNLPWSKFWINNQKLLLSQVPTPKRQITLNDIRNASPPYFPPSTVNSLKWLNDCQPIIYYLRKQSKLYKHDPLHTNRLDFNRQAYEDEIQEQIDRIVHHDDDDDEPDDHDLQLAVLESLLHAQNNEISNNRPIQDNSYQKTFLRRFRNCFRR